MNVFFKKDAIPAVKQQSRAKLTPLPPSVRLSANRTRKYEQDFERKEASGSCGCSAWLGVPNVNNLQPCGMN